MKYLDRSEIIVAAVSDSGKPHESCVFGKIKER